MDAQQYAAQVDDLEKKLERLRALYDQYFMGIEKIEPTIPRKAIDRRIHDLRKERVHNTALRFRFQTLIQRYTTLMTYWTRTCRQIEEGTYKRDILRAARLVASPEDAGGEAAAAGGESRRAADGELAIDVVIADAAAAGAGAESPAGEGDDVARVRSLDDLRALLGDDVVVAPEPKSPPRPAAATSPPRPGPIAVGRPESGIGDDTLRRVHAAYCRARGKAGGSGAVPSVDSIRSVLEKEAARMRLKHPGKEIDFRVTLRDGKPVIKSYAK